MSYVRLTVGGVGQFAPADWSKGRFGTPKSDGSSVAYVGKEILARQVTNVSLELPKFENGPNSEREHRRALRGGSFSASWRGCCFKAGRSLHNVFAIDKR